MKIIGIESSCDDTGIALIDNDQIIENIVISQTHKYGVIPELAARDHLNSIYEATQKIFKKPDLIAYTNGPGLMGSLFIGSSFAKGLAYGLNVPNIAINHLEGHILLPVWLYKIQLPCLCLLVSGGHTILILINSLRDYKILAESVDDAVGEILDKIARYIGLGYPGGPKIEELALKATHVKEYKFPMPMKGKDNFSFSGLKTAAINQVEPNCLDADFCFQLQNHIALILTEKFMRFYQEYNVKNWILSGGVAANKVIRDKIDALAAENDCVVYYPPINLCTDNGLMIAAAASLLFPILGVSSYNIKPEPNLKF